MKNSTLADPSVAGTPLISPLEESRRSPLGREFAVQVYGALPPAPSSSAEYSPPTVPSGKVVVSILGQLGGHLFQSPWSDAYSATATAPPAAPRMIGHFDGPLSTKPGETARTSNVRVIDSAPVVTVI